MGGAATDKRSFLTADTLDELEAAIRSDYGRNPVPRDCDPPDATDYLEAPESGRWWGEGDEEWDGDNCRIYEPAVPQPQGTSDDGAALDPETALILAELKTLFPRWEVTYSAALGTWTAKSQYGSFCEPTIALVWVGLTRMERKIDWD